MIHLRAKHWFLVFTAAVLVLSLLFCHRLYRMENGVKTTSSEQDNSHIIIVDAGHGGFDGGAVGTRGTVEKEINLDIALKLRDMLEAAGYTVVMTRETDTATNDNDNTSIRSKKVSDMRNRLNLTKVYPGSTLVSIHQNKLEGSSSVRGAQVFYSPNRESSKALAESIQQEFNAAIQPEKPRETVKTGKNLYLFYHAQNTAVLCECGFLSNPQEEVLLNTDEYQTKIAYIIYRGLLLYQEEARQPSA